MTEHELMQQIMLHSMEYGAKLFRANVGAVRQADGRYFSTGLPKGYSDLTGHRISDGKAVYIEVKGAKGRLRKEQVLFLKAMIADGCCAGVAYSLEDAASIIRWNLNDKSEMIRRIG